MENLKTVGEEHSNLTGGVSITRKYADSHITDNFDVLEKYRSEEGADGRCYDWYVIDHHSRYEDRFTPGIVATEQEITAQDIAIMEAEQTITELDLRIMELEMNA
jgi:hypothetical protein